MAVHEELVVTLEQLRRELEEFAVRGLRAVGPRQLGKLTQLREELAGVGVEHLAGLLQELEAGLKSDSPAAARALLRAQTALRIFERLLTLQVVGGQLQVLIDRRDGDTHDVPGAQGAEDIDEFTDEDFGTDELDDRDHARGESP